MAQVANDHLRSQSLQFFGCGGLRRSRQSKHLKAVCQERPRDCAALSPRGATNKHAMNCGHGQLLAVARHNVDTVHFDNRSRRCQHGFRSQTREAYHHGDLRNPLISSAVRLIEQGGEAAFSLREAARDVGVSANAAYRHFDDKSALLTAAAAGRLEQLANRMLKAMDRAAESERKEKPAIARFKAVGRAYVEFAMAHPELFRLMFSGSGVACLTSAAAGVATPTPWKLLGRSLDALVADGAGRRVGGAATAGPRRFSARPPRSVARRRHAARRPASSAVR